VSWSVGGSSDNLLVCSPPPSKYVNPALIVCDFTPQFTFVDAAKNCRPLHPRGHPHRRSPLSRLPPSSAPHRSGASSPSCCVQTRRRHGDRSTATSCRGGAASTAAALNSTSGGSRGGGRLRLGGLTPPLPARCSTTARFLTETTTDGPTAQFSTKTRDRQQGRQQQRRRAGGSRLGRTHVDRLPIQRRRNH